MRVANTNSGGLAALGTAAERRRFCRQLRPTQRARFCSRTGTEILPRHRYRHSDAAFASFEPIRLYARAAIGRAVAADRRNRTRVLARSQAAAVTLGEARAKGEWSGARPASAALLRTSLCRERSRSTPNRRSMSTRTGGTIGPVELSLPPRLACQLLSAPAIPRAQVAEVSRRRPGLAGTSSRAAACAARARSRRSKRIRS